MTENPTHATVLFPTASMAWAGSQPRSSPPGRATCSQPWRESTSLHLGATV